MQEAKPYLSDASDDTSVPMHGLNEADSRHLLARPLGEAPLAPVNCAPEGDVARKGGIQVPSPPATTAKRQWSEQEDRLLLDAITKYGAQRWRLIAECVQNGRHYKHCRDRWLNHLCPEVKKGEWTEEEDRLIAEGVAELGTRWSEIVKRLPGRTDNAIKNRYNLQQRRLQRREREAAVEASSAGAAWAVAGAAGSKRKRPRADGAPPSTWASAGDRPSAGLAVYAPEEIGEPPVGVGWRRASPHSEEETAVAYELVEAAMAAQAAEARRLEQEAASARAAAHWIRATHTTSKPFQPLSCAAAATNAHSAADSEQTSMLTSPASSSPRESGPPTLDAPEAGEQLRFDAQARPPTPKLQCAPAAPVAEGVEGGAVAGQPSQPATAEDEAEAFEELSALLRARPDLFANNGGAAAGAGASRLALLRQSIACVQSMYSQVDELRAAPPPPMNDDRALRVMWGDGSHATTPGAAAQCLWANAVAAADHRDMMMAAWRSEPAEA